MKTKTYVIEVLGYGKNTKYALRQRVGKGAFNGALYVSKSLEATKKYAEDNGIEITAIGDTYEIA